MIYLSLFCTDIIELTVKPSGTFLDENDISWASDRSTKFVQVQGFVSKGNKNNYRNNYKNCVRGYM